MKESELKNHERAALSFYIHDKNKDKPHWKDQFDDRSLVVTHWMPLPELPIAEKLEPELNPVDMSVLVESGIDCCFAMRYEDFDESLNLGFLVKITKRDFVCCDGIHWDCCKPRMNYWFSAENFKNINGLVGELREAGFEVETKDMTIEVAETGVTYTAITAFMIKDKKADRCWPWEVE